AFLLVVFASFGWSGIAAIAIALFVTWAYSAPPLRFKNRPGLDLLVHAVFVETFPYLVCLTLAQLTWTRLDVVLLVVLFLASLTAQLEQQLRDFDVDVETGRTFATVVGRRNTSRLLQLATALLILVGAYHVFDGTIPLFVTAFGLIGLPALLHRFLRGRSKPRSEKLVYLSALTGLAYVGLILIFYVARS
ncbi:MAG: UbiA family prenyltransferase, partial [Chloroflexota bacterium]